ncbi:MAG: hypothetical protein JWN42_2141, partial [Candidatus Angelobacter sp.]|nr:hypothetical protein [Candidatus Angelobacter sp.]
MKTALLLAIAECRADQGVTVCRTTF